MGIDWPTGVAHPFSPPGMADPHRGYAVLREQAPVYFESMAGLWLVTSHRGCRQVLTDPGFSAQQAQGQRSQGERMPVSMLNVDGPEHRTLRNPAQLLLGPAAVDVLVAKLGPQIQQLADDMLNRVVALPFEVVSTVGTPFALLVISELLGLSGDATRRLGEVAPRVAGHLDPMLSPADTVATSAATDGLIGLLTRALQVAGELDEMHPLRRYRDECGLRTEQQLSTLMLAVIGGFDPLLDLAANLAVRMSTDAGIRSLVRDGRASEVIDEILRLDSPLTFAARVAAVDLRVGEVEIPAGSVVLAVIAAANRDPEVFASPDEFDIGARRGADLSFGAGPHYCAGATLVRRSAIALAEVLVDAPQATLHDLRRRPRMIPRTLTRAVLAG